MGGGGNEEKKRLLGVQFRMSPGSIDSSIEGWGGEKKA